MSHPSGVTNTREGQRAQGGIREEERSRYERILKREEEGGRRKGREGRWKQRRQKGGGKKEEEGGGEKQERMRTNGEGNRRGQKRKRG